MTSRVIRTFVRKRFMRDREHDHLDSEKSFGLIYQRSHNPDLLYSMAGSGISTNNVSFVKRISINPWLSHASIERLILGQVLEHVSTVSTDDRKTFLLKSICEKHTS